MLIQLNVSSPPVIQPPLTYAQMRPQNGPPLPLDRKLRLAHDLPALPPNTCATPHNI